MMQSPIISVLEKVEELRQFVSNPTDLDFFLEKVERLEKIMPSVDKLNEIIKRLTAIEEGMYMFKEFWSAEEAAKFLGVHKSRIYRLSSENEIPIYKPNERVMYIKRQDVIDWMEQFRVKSSAEILASANLTATKYEMSNNKNSNYGK